MTKPRLVKVRALLYVLHHIKKETAPILTQPLFIFHTNLKSPLYTEKNLFYKIIDIVLISSVCLLAQPVGYNHATGHSLMSHKA